MKASIIITGQIMGNFTLRDHLQTLDAVTVSKLPFNAFRIQFNTIKEARAAMNQAYKDLKQETSNLSYFGDKLLFDASKATLHRERNF